MEMSSHPLDRTKWVLVDVIPAVAMIGHQVRMERKYVTSWQNKDSLEDPPAQRRQSTEGRVLAHNGEQ